jgi:hypothetical protein
MRLQALGARSIGLYTRAMLDLYRLLAEQPLAMLGAIAESWQVALAESDPIRAAQLLGDAMLASGAVERRVAALSPGAREALGVLRREGGRATVKSLALRFGELRRIGPAALERERPWKHPMPPLEELVYSGLAFRAFGAAPGGHGELLLAPRELLERLPASGQPPVVDAPLADLPDRVADQGLALSEDLLALLSHLRRAQPRIDEAAPERLPTWLAESGPLGEGPLAGRWIGSPTPDRLALLWRLAWQLRLVSADGGRLRPALAARDWLRAPDGTRAGRLYRAWRDDAQWVDLAHVAAVTCDPGGCPHDPAAPRRNLCALLRQLEPNRWHRLADVVQALKRHRPTYLRPDADLTSWFIRDAASGEYLSGPASWELVEGRLAEHLLTQPLHWLGMVRLGSSGEGALADRLALTDLGAAILGRGARPPARRPEPLARIAADGAINVALTQSSYERYQLERIAEWQGQDEVASYRLTESSVWGGDNAGISVPQIAAFLRRITGGAVPAGLQLTLQAWEARFGRATLRQAVLLEFADEETAREALGDKQIAPLIAQALTPTLMAVRPNDIQELIAALQGRGIWPRLPLDGDL